MICSFVSLVGLESVLGAAEISWSLEASGAAEIFWSLEALGTIGAAVGAFSWSFEALVAAAPFFALFVGIFCIFTILCCIFSWLPWPFLSPI